MICKGFFVQENSGVFVPQFWDTPVKTNMTMEKLPFDAFPIENYDCPFSS